VSAACLDCASVGAGGVYGGKIDVRVGEGVSNRQYEVARVVIKVCGGKRSKAGGCARPCVMEQALCVWGGGAFVDQGPVYVDRDLLTLCLCVLSVSGPWQPSLTVCTSVHVAAQSCPRSLQLLTLSPTVE
jgi:hypothetical protein